MSLQSGFWLSVAAYALVIATLEASRFLENQTVRDFLFAERRISLPVTSLSFLAANCSALEVITILAISAKYGLLALHFFWIGAIPALAFLLWVLLPLYRRHRVRSVPEFLARRYSRAAQTLSAAAFCALMIAVSGITLCVASRLLHLVAPISYGASIGVLSVAACVFLIGGGLSAVMYAEAVQLLIFLLILVPLTLQSLRQAGSLALLLTRLPASARHTFQGVPWVAPHASADLLGIVVGLGGVLSFTYWCADFRLVQRFGAARTFGIMRRTPLTAMVAKLALPLLLVLPGLLVYGTRGDGDAVSFDLLLPYLILRLYSVPLGALALATLLISLFIGVCSNIAAGVAILASDLYEPFAPIGNSDQGRLFFSRLATLCLALLASGAAYLSFQSDALMEYIQLVLSSFNVPVATVFLAGIFVPRLSPLAGAPGIAAGTIAGLAAWKAAHRAHFGNGLTQSFYLAIFSACSSSTAMALIHFCQPKTIVIHKVEFKQSSSPDDRPPKMIKALVLISLLSAATLYTLFF